LDALNAVGAELSLEVLAAANVPGVSDLPPTNPNNSIVCLTGIQSPSIINQVIDLLRIQEALES
jgi:hypothetical protein